MCSSLRCVSAIGGVDWVLKRGVWSVNLGKRLLQAAWRQPEGIGVRSSTVSNTLPLNALRGSTDCHGSKVPLLSSTQKAGPPSWPLSPNSSPWLCGHLEDSCQSKCVCPSHCCLVLLTTEWACVPGQLQPLAPPTLVNKCGLVSSCLHPPLSWVGLKPKLSPRGCGAKEKELKLLFIAVEAKG